MHHRVALAGIISVAGLLLASATGDAQGLGDRLKKRASEAAKRATEQKVDQKATEATNAALDKAENTIKCATSDTACQEKAKADGKKVVIDDTAPKGGTSAAVAPASTAASDGASSTSVAKEEAAFVNFDFVPGERVLFADDFSKDNVGDFPKRLEFVKGNMEVAEWKGARWLRATTDGQLEIPLPENLPDRFTVEFEHVGMASTWPFVTLTFAGKRDDRGSDQVIFKTWDGNSASSGGGVFGGDGSERAKGIVKDAQNQPFTARIMVDGRYAKVYMGGTRVANVPNANLGRASKIFLMFDASADNPAYFRNFRVAAGGRKLYDAIAEKGRASTQGIYFDTGSDGIRPESAPTLKEIGDMLKEHGDLKLAIEGHTDNVGAAAGNQSLSEKRAAAVRQYLIDKYSIDGARLVAKGLGATKPVTSNDTPEGRQNNRRVELVKM